MEYPKTFEEVKTGRSSFSDYIQKYYPDFFIYLNDKYQEDCTLQAKMYMFLHNIDTIPVCKTCGKQLRFFSPSKGFGKYCSSKCAMSDKEHIEKQKNTCLEKYGSKNNINKCRETKKQRYGDCNYNNSEKSKSTCLERYGVDNPQKYLPIQEKTKKTNKDRYGSEYVLTSEFFLKNKKDFEEKSKSTCLERYGVESVMMSDEIKEKVKQTCISKYGVYWNCMRKEAHNSRNTKSKPNEFFSLLLKINNISYEREFSIGKYSYDFKVNNTLIEINPSATHNINWNPFNKDKAIDKNYHLSKTLTAKNNGYKCIHIWDWDDIDKVLYNLKEKTKIFARKCIIKEIPKKMCDDFLNNYHFQNSCRGQVIRLGLFYNNELIEVMTFGKPRYNKNYEYELLRLCTYPSYIVIGGSEKLFKYFVENKTPKSIISYCDMSKFDGGIYSKLGFKKQGKNSPSCHWYNPKTNGHITDNLLRQKGFDRLFKTNYGKGKSNEQLMLNNGWLQIYDSGQSTYIWENGLLI